MPDPLEMPIRWFGIAIGVEAGGFRVVTSVHDMSKLLVEGWPEDRRGDAWRVAVASCHRALERQSNAAAAREAFIMAANASEIAVDGNHERFEPPPKREKPNKR